jgi:MinD-like ATPase involved in chromosome partitioning or flagellar assembly/ActR/RegA family two-component response regulator
MEPPVSGQTILIVDGDLTSVKYLAHMLQGQGYSILSAGLGKEGLINIWRDRPELIIFDPALKDIPFEEFVQKICHDPRSANIPILAFSSDASPEKKNACLQAGCNQYIVKSAEAVTTLPGVISGLLAEKEARVAKNQEEKKEEVQAGGLLIVFLSAKGGTGTSSLCANYAMTMHNNKPEADVVVMDLVLPIGSIALIVGYDDEVDLVSVSEMSPDEITGEYFHKHLPEIEAWGFQLLPGANNPERANNLQVNRIPEILKALQTAYDYVVIDLGRSLSRISMPIIQKADLLVLTVSTDQSTITLTKEVWDYLQTKGIESKKIFAILNRAVGLEGLTKAEAEKIIDLPIQTVIPYMGGNFALANNLNQPIITKYPEDTTAIVLKETANNMINLAGKLRNK